MGRGKRPTKAEMRATINAFLPDDGSVQWGSDFRPIEPAITSEISAADVASGKQAEPAGRGEGEGGSKSYGS